MNKKEVKDLWNTNHKGRYKLREFDVCGDHIHFEFSHYKFKGESLWYNISINRITRKLSGYVTRELKDQDGSSWIGLVLNLDVPKDLPGEVENFFYNHVVSSYSGREPLWIKNEFLSKVAYEQEPKI